MASSKSNTLKIGERVGKRIQLARNESNGGKGHTQQEIAKILNISKVSLSRWERGERSPSYEMLYEFAKIVDKPLYFFFEDDPTDISGQQILLRITKKDLDEKDRNDIMKDVTNFMNTLYKDLLDESNREIR